ncbi:fetuin-B [Trichosurus vulpecula]|uniref:fetuin-B n=1 Tax=Trichosurus vulpecula TaxID=9337 RepID=UPI00186AE7DA|nr:fetuin-B [Trichosurus vulpecula]
MTGISLFLGLLVLVPSCWSDSIPAAPLLLPRSCNDSQVLSVAGLALQGINDDRKEGYVFSLNRVADVQEQHQTGSSSMYYLTLDVLETDCHVLSRKRWKDCATRILHETVYGQCKAIFYTNLPKRILHLPVYNCTVRPVSRRKIVRMCPDCPSPSSTDNSDPQVSRAVSESLEKINKEVAVGKKFYLFQVTRASSQWVFGPAYLVEYLVTEAPCTKSLPDSEECLQPPADSKPVGICKGSLSSIGEIKHVSGNCEFFQSQPTPAPGSQPPEHQDPQQLPLPATAAPLEERPKGSVQFLSELVDENEKKPFVDFPVHIDLTTEPQGEVLHLPSRFMLEKEEMPIVLPFPKRSRSNECPGPAENSDPLILPP